MNKKIAVLGAFDRFNYGDLLFPLIIEKMLEKYRSEYNIEYYGLIESDLSRYGAKPTRPIKFIFKKEEIPAESIIIIAGGEILNASWISMHMYLLPKTKSILLLITKIILGEKLANKISGYFLGSKLQMPWIISPCDFYYPVKIVYNTVGGSKLSSLAYNYEEVLKSKLSKAAFLSVRDEKTNIALQNLQLKNHVRVAPDSAILMSEFFPIDELKTKINCETQKIIDNFPNGYLCFQSNYIFVKNSEHLIANELEKIYEEFGYGIVLLPIGKATGHDDYKSATKIRMLLNMPSIIPNESNVFDIMMLIAKSKIFIGTSLHGNITALSFCVPHIGLSTKDPKLESFLESWDLLEQASCTPYNEIHIKMKSVMKIQKKELEKKRNELVTLSYFNFRYMMIDIGLSVNEKKDRCK